MLRRCLRASLLVAGFVSHADAALTISEIMARGTGTQIDGAEFLDDWIELHNPSDAEVDLGGLYLTDDPEDPRKFRIPEETSVPPGGFVVFEADGENVPFRLSADGDEVVVLVARDGTTVIDQLAIRAPQYAGVSFGRASTDPTSTFYFAEPTPGAANDKAGVPVLELITFSEAQGIFVEPFRLSLTSATEGVTIRYTLDGILPHARSPAFHDQIPIAGTVTVRAAQFLGAVRIGPVQSHTYLLVDEELAGFSSNLPLVLIDSDGYDFSRDSQLGIDYPPQTVAASFIDTDESGRAKVTGATDYVGLAGMNVRGASSRAWPKKQYKFETWSEQNEEREVGLLGLPADSDWVLHAPYFEKTLMRNYLVYLWWGRLGYYSVRTRFMEAFINMRGDETISMDDYVGVYLLFEKIKRAPRRVDVARLKPTDVDTPEITGGYVVQSTNIDQHFTSQQGVRFKYVDPKREETEFLRQHVWIRNHLDRFERVVFSREFADPETGYRRYIHLQSHLDYDIFREFTRNIDGASTFLSLDRGGKIEMGPLWDYNQSLGMTSLWNGFRTDGWNETYMTEAAHWPKWWREFDDDPEYQRAWEDRWVELRDGPLATEVLLADIDATAALLREAQTRNYRRWRVLGQEAWPGREAPGWRERDTFAKEVAWMRNWLDERLQWIDEQVPAPVSFSEPAGAVEVGTRVELAAEKGFKPVGGDIVFTTDGSDPLLTDGELYSDPVVIDRSSTITARVKGSRGWGTLRRRAYFVGTRPANADSLALTEIHYHPADSDREEFLEFTNKSAHPIDLNGVRIDSGVRFTFGDLILAPGQSTVVVDNPVTFAKRYQKEWSESSYGDILVAGEWSGDLSNGGERISVVAINGDPILSMEYNDRSPWPEAADGKGPSLELVDLSRDPTVAGNWRASSVPYGTPGRILQSASLHIASITAADDRVEFVVQSELASDDLILERSGDLVSWNEESFTLVNEDEATLVVRFTGPLEAGTQFFRFRSR